MNEMRTWAEISLGALSHNLAAVRSMTGKAIMAVVKADAYGHGALPVALRLQQDGADFLAVATADEALQLRDGGVQAPILVLGYVPPARLAGIAERDVSITLFDPEQARTMSGAAGQRRVRVHAKIDTGMSRLGFQSVDELEAACRLPGFVPEGLFSHLATADAPDDGFVGVQAERFAAAVDSLRRRGLDFAFVHCANSGGVINYSEIPGNTARAGLLLYGCHPAGRSDARLRPVMRWCATVAQVKRLQAGDTVSYGRAFAASAGTTVAVLACGYADGYHRSLSNKGAVLLGGGRAPVRGSICMDMMIVDVSRCGDVRPGDTAVLFGEDGGTRLTVDELAPLAGTIPYELLCSVSARVPRFYV